MQPGIGRTPLHATCTTVEGGIHDDHSGALRGRAGFVTTRSYEQFCPAARALDLLGERWTLLIVRDLLSGPKRWSDLRDLLPRLGTNLLAERLKALEAAGIVVRRDLPAGGSRPAYDLTDRGRELDAVVMSLARFGLPYLDAPTDEQPLLPHLRDEALRTAVRCEALPERGGSIRFELTEGRYLLSVAPLSGSDGVAQPFHRRVVIEPLEGGDTPDADAVVTGSLPVVLWVRRGDIEWDDALAQGHLQVEGRNDLVRRLFGDGRIPA